MVCACTVCKYGVLSKPIHTCTGENGHRVPTKVTSPDMAMLFVPSGCPHPPPPVPPFLLTHRTLPEVTSQAEGHMMSTCTSSRVVKG